MLLYCYCIVCIMYFYRSAVNKSCSFVRTVLHQASLFAHALYIQIRKCKTYSANSPILSDRTPNCTDRIVTVCLAILTAVKMTTMKIYCLKTTYSMPTSYNNCNNSRLSIRLVINRFHFLPIRLRSLSTLLFDVDYTREQRRRRERRQRTINFIRRFS